MGPAQSFRPIVFMNGDDSARRVALVVRDNLYSFVPLIGVDLGVEARIKSNDQCLDEAAALLSQYRGGIKISTATNDYRIQTRGWKSANTRLRELMKTVGLYRQTMASGAYRRPVGVMCFASGDYFCETSCQLIPDAGPEVYEIRQHLNAEYLLPFANAAVDRARANNLQIVLSSKWTISEGEKLLADRCERAFLARGLVTSNVRGHGDFYRELPDTLASLIPTNVAPPGLNGPIRGDNGGWLIVTGNSFGDIFSDLIDLQHGGCSMGSECICYDGFSYFELPSGTAPGRANSSLKGEKFFSPISTIVAFNGAIVSANPTLKPYCDAVLAAAVEYIQQTEPSRRCTISMLESIGQTTATLRPHLNQNT